MATVQGIREKVHLPIYDSIFVKPEEQLRKAEPGSTLKFFVNVQGKTKLETNLQSASLLPHYNTFEARAMRVVISDLPPEFSEDAKSKSDEQFVVLKPDSSGGEPTEAGFKVTIKAGLKRLMELLAKVRKSEEDVEIEVTDNPDVVLPPNTTPPADAFLLLSEADIEGLIDSLEKDAPPPEQIRPNDGVISKLIYNTVTTFFVGEKIMMEMPTWFFPSGAGPYSLSTRAISHGEPSPTATFRFAEPIFIDKQQNFRVEISIPDTDVLKQIQQIYGPLFLWVVLDGYMTRDVQ